eukprot:m.223514 g.223514  ORF g.223514 m.223514 type:complete len:447 (+) comp17271_c0_seq2:2993-4333(+)
MPGRRPIFLSICLSLVAGQDASSTMYMTSNGDLHLASDLNGSILLNDVNVVTHVKSLEEENKQLTLQVSALTHMLDATCQATFAGAATPMLLRESASCIESYTNPASGQVGFASASATPFEASPDYTMPSIYFYKWQGGEFVRDRAIETPMHGPVLAMDMVTFHNATYLATLYTNSVGQRATVFVFNSTCNCYTLLHDLTGYQMTGTAIIPFQDDVFWITTAAGSTAEPAQTKVYLNFTTPPYTLNVEGASGVSATEIAGELQVVVASSGNQGVNGTVEGRSNTTVYHWDGQQFVFNSYLPSYRALGVEHVTIAGTTYLLLLNSRLPNQEAEAVIELYRWDPTSREYLVHQSFDVPAVSPASSLFELNNHNYLALSGDAGSVLYRWNEREFALNQALGGHSKYTSDFEFAQIDGQAFLATAREPDYPGFSPNPVFQWMTCRFATVV